MMDKNGLRRDSLREGLKVKGRSRREAAARHAEAEKGSRPRRNDILPLLQIEAYPVDALKSHVRKQKGAVGQSAWSAAEVANQKT